VAYSEIGEFFTPFLELLMNERERDLESDDSAYTRTAQLLLVIWTAGGVFGFLLGVMVN
jgi:hypothetical protein